MENKELNSTNPIFTDLISISGQIREILLQKKYKQQIRCGLIVFLIVLIFLYQVMYIAKDCYIEVYSYYQIIIICLLLIDFYIDVLCVKVINQYIIIFNWESSKSNEEKYDQLKNFKVRQIIYKLINKNQTTDILPLTVVHHKKMVVGAFALVFFTQFYFASNYEEFQCYFSFEPIIMNITFWFLYLMIIVFTKFQIIFQCCKNMNQKKLQNNVQVANLKNKQSQGLSVEQLEEQWKLRSTCEKVVYSKKKQQSQSKNQQSQNYNNYIFSAQKLEPNKENCQNDKQQNFELTHNLIQQLQQNSERLQAHNIIQENDALNKKAYSQIQVGSLCNVNMNSHIMILNNDEKKTCVPQGQQSNQNLDESVDYDICQICLVELQDGQLGREMKCCKKIFHKECCLQWFNTKETCPNCRSLPLVQF